MYLEALVVWADKINNHYATRVYAAIDTEGCRI